MSGFTNMFWFVAIVQAVACFPTQTLDELNQGVSWQAWLLVDDQNQNRPPESSTRRRIVPKSVFIAPTFSPESLPSCSEGYSQDAMLRCIKIIKLDEDAHLKFLVDKLNDKFGDMDYGEEEEGSSEQPFQLKIPVIDYDNNREDNVSPTSNFGEMQAQVGKRVEDNLEKDLVRLVRTTTKNYETTTNLQEDTTQYQATTTTTDEPPKTTTYLPAEEETETTTTEATTTSTDLPSTTVLDEFERELLEVKTTTTEKISSTTPRVTTYHPTLILTTVPSSTTRSNRIRFPDDFKPTQTTLYDIKFPDSKTKSGLHTRDLNGQLRDYDPRWTFPVDVATPRSYHRRNRERHNSLFVLQPKWDQVGVEKPLILKISKNNFVDANRFKDVFLRAVPQEDFPFLFRKKDR